MTIVAKYKGEIVGFYKREGILKVHPDHRRKRVGTLLYFLAKDKDYTPTVVSPHGVKFFEALKIKAKVCTLDIKGDQLYLDKVEIFKRELNMLNIEKEIDVTHLIEGKK